MTTKPKRKHDRTFLDHDRTIYDEERLANAHEAGSNWSEEPVEFVASTKHPERKRYDRAGWRAGR